MIPKNFDEAFTEVAKLVANFKTNLEYYLSKDYNESDVRKDFIDRFFLALGWDMYHAEQTNPYEREVRIEKSVTRETCGLCFLFVAGFSTDQVHLRGEKADTHTGE